jgi:ATPase subunit of ABC transporter with duplicated ATPase domains
MAALRPGEQRRIWLASVLLARPDCLVLDEPTYYLDDSATRWLSTQLQSYPGTVLLVSHDQILLENVADTIWEVVPSRYTVQEYGANYSAYLAARGKSPTETSPLTSERYSKISTRR